MAIKKRDNPVPLIIENYPTGYSGHPFITLIQHRKHHVLTIVDNADEKTINAYVLDMCGPEHVDENMIIDTAADWFYNQKQKFPLSFQFSRLGMAHETSKIYRTYHIEFVTRIIGPLPRFEMDKVQSVKRRRCKYIPSGANINKKIISLV